jgi:hypothetical protein
MTLLDLQEAGSSGTLHRIKRKIARVQGFGRQLDLATDHETEMRENGDIVTVETTHLQTINGETIHRPEQILGQCQAESCGVFLTERVFRYCQGCGLVLCLNHAYRDHRDGVWLCKQCLWTARLRRLFGLRTRSSR